MGRTVRVEELQVVGDHRLLLTVSPRFAAEMEFTADLLDDAPAALADPAYFASVQIDTLGQLVWPNGYTFSNDLLREQLGAAGDGPPATQPPPAADGEDKGKDSGGLTVPALLGTIVSGLGVLGFVTLAGGVVLWSRFNEMGIPADHALGLVPKSELVSTGADFLVPAFLISTGVVLAVVLLGITIDFFEEWKPLRWGVTPTVIGIAEVVVLVSLTQALPAGAVVLLILVIAIGALAISSGARLNLALFAIAIFVSVGAFAVARTYELTSHDLKVLPMAYSRTQPGEATRVEVGYFVAETSDRILFASLPKVSTTEATAAPNELREFPRDEADDLEIGELARPQQAEKTAARFAFNLCERLAHLTPMAAAAGGSSVASNGKAVVPATKTTAVCPPSYMKELAAKAGLPWKPSRSEQLAAGLTACHAHHGRSARIHCEQRMLKLYGPKKHRHS